MPVPDSRLSLFVSEREFNETSSLRVGTRTPLGDPKLVGDPVMFSSWFDGVIPIPSEGAFVGGGGAWAGSGGSSLSEPGETLNATFEYLKRTEIELKDETRMLAEVTTLLSQKNEGTLYLRTMNLRRPTTLIQPTRCGYERTSSRSRKRRRTYLRHHDFVQPFLGLRVRHLELF